MLTENTALKVLQGVDGNIVHCFGKDVGQTSFSDYAMKIVANEEGFVRMWIEEKGIYGYKWRTQDGTLLDDEPKKVS